VNERAKFCGRAYCSYETNNFFILLPQSQLVYGKTPFSDLHMIPKLQAIVNPNHEINFPVGECVDEAAIDAIKLCLIRKAEKRPPIVGDGGEEEDVGLLTGHWFLHSEKT